MNGQGGRISALAAAVIALLLGGLAAPVAAATPATMDVSASAANASLKPIVAANPQNDFATKDMTTIVMTGEDLPVIPTDDLGVYIKTFAQVKSSAGWTAGLGTGAGWFTPDCFVVVGHSTPTEVVIGVGNMGKFCFSHIKPGEQITVTLFDPSGKAIDGATASGTAVANGGAIPVVNSVTPPFGPESGGNPDDPTTNSVVVSTGSTAAPIAVWFGGYQVGLGWYGVATTAITAKGGDQYAVVPPAFRSGKSRTRNYGVSVFVADSSNGFSNQLCNVMITGCANEYFYMNHSKAGPVDISPAALTIEPVTKTFGGTPSPACGLATGGGSGGSVSFSTKVTGEASLTGQSDVSLSNSGIPQAIVGSATVKVTQPIVVEATLEGQITGCLAIPFPPPLAIKNVIGLYFVLGGQINGKIVVTITIAKGTYTFNGGWLPGVAGRTDTGGFAKSVVNCVDESGNPSQSCISTKLDAGISGSLSISPLWVQIGPSDGPLQANLGVGLTAAGFIGAEVSIPPWPPSPTFSWDLCVAVRWAAQVALPAFSFERSTGGTFLGPYNIAGDGSKCPLGPTSGSATAASAGDSTVAASPGAATADGTAKSTVTVTLKDAGGKPLLGKAVTLSQDDGKSSVISAPSGLSDANGVVTFTVSDATAETVTYTATDTTDNVALTQTVNVTFTPAGVASAAAGEVSPVLSTITAGPGGVPANGVTTSTVTVTVKDSTGAPVVGKSVSLTQPDGRSSVISAPSGPSDADGVVTFTVKNSTVEPVTYTATDTTDGIVLISTVNVMFGPVRVSALESRVDAEPDTVEADGVSPTTITVTLNDDGGQPVPGKTVSLSGDPGTSVKITTTTNVTDENGQVRFAVTDAVLESVQFTAVDVTDNITLLQRDDVDFEAGPTSAARSTVVADPPSVPANGFTTSTIVVTLKDRSGHPVIDGTPVLTADGGGSVISEADGPSDDNGVVTFEVTNSSVETVTYTVTDTTDNVVLDQKVTVAFGPVRMSPAASWIEAGADSVPADGTSTSSITVTLLDDGDGPIAGHEVRLAQDAGKSSVITPVSAVSDANGVVTFAVSDTVAEQVSYTAFDVTAGEAVADSAGVTFIAPGTGMSATDSTVQSAPGFVANDGKAAATITVTLRDSFGQPLAGRAVTLAQDAGKSSVISNPSGLSDSDGVVTFTVTNTKAETVTYAATNASDEVAVAQTARVVFGPAASAVPFVATLGRLLETRPDRSTTDGQSNGIGRRAGGSVTVVPVGGRAGVPGDAKAVALNVTVVDAGADGYGSVFPCGSVVPSTSVVNFTAGQTISGAALVALGTSGSVCVFTSADIDLVVDVNGQFPMAAGFAPLPSARLSESRGGLTTVDGVANGLGPRAAGSVTEVQVAGRGGVDAASRAVALNVTVVAPQGDGYVSVFPCGGVVPQTSNVNFTTGQTMSNSVIAAMGPSGSVCVFTSAALDLVVDVNGQFPVGAGFAPLPSVRLLESRGGFSTVDGAANGVGMRVSGSVTEIATAGRGGVDASARAVALNITVVNARGAGFVSVFACGGPVPPTSNVNFTTGQTVSNSVIAAIGGSASVCVFTSADIDLVVDVNGQFPLGL